VFVFALIFLHFYIKKSLKFQQFGVELSNATEITGQFAFALLNVFLFKSFK